MQSIDSKINLDIFNLLNSLRADPKTLVPDLTEMAGQFDGDVHVRPSGNIRIKTQEGPKAVQEAIAFLQQQAGGLKALKLSQGLTLACTEHVNDIGPKGLVQSESSAGTSVKDRLSKHGKIVAAFGENLSFGCVSAKEVVMQNLISDGNPSRGHRANIFNPDFNYVGIGTAAHSKYNSITCCDFAGGFTVEGEEDPIQAQIQAFLNTKEEFEMPPGAGAYKENTKISVQGLIATKTVTRDVTLSNGLQQTIEKQFTKKLEL